VALSFEDVPKGRPWRSQDIDRLRAELALIGLAPTHWVAMGWMLEPTFTITIPPDWSYGRHWAELTVTNLRRIGSWPRYGAVMDICITKWRRQRDQAVREREIRYWQEDRDTEFRPFPPDFEFEIPVGPRKTLPERTAHWISEQLRVDLDGREAAEA